MAVRPGRINIKATIFFAHSERIRTFLVVVKSPIFVLPGTRSRVLPDDGEGRAGEGQGKTTNPHCTGKPLRWPLHLPPVVRPWNARRVDRAFGVREGPLWEYRLRCTVRTRTSKFSTTLFAGTRTEWSSRSYVGTVAAYARVSPRSGRTKNIRGSRFKTFQRGRCNYCCANGEPDALVAAVQPSSLLSVVATGALLLAGVCPTRNNRGHNSD